jgi:uncharacterized membrane protein
MKDLALSSMIFATILFFAIGGVDRAVGGRHPFFLYAGLLTLLVLIALLLVYILRAAMHAMTRRFR